MPRVEKLYEYTYMAACCLCCWPCLGALFCGFTLLQQHNNRRRDREYKEGLVRTKEAFPDFPERFDAEFRAKFIDITGWNLSHLYQTAHAVKTDEECENLKRKELIQYFENMIKQTDDSNDQQQLLDELTICVGDNEFHLWCNISIIRSFLVEQNLLQQSDDNIRHYRLEFTNGMGSEESIFSLLRYMYTGETLLPAKREELNALFLDLCSSTKDPIEKARIVSWIKLLVELLSFSTCFNCQEIFQSVILYLQEIRMNWLYDLTNTIQDIERECPSLSADVQKLLSVILAQESITVPGSMISLTDVRIAFGDIQLQTDNTVDQTSEVECAAVHKHILIARSAYFNSLLHSHMKESTETVLTVPGCASKSVLDLYVGYLYTGQIEKACSQHVLELFTVANVLDDKVLQEICSGFIVQQLTEDDILDVYEFSKSYIGSDLQSRCEMKIIYLQETSHVLSDVIVPISDDLKRYEYHIHRADFTSYLPALCSGFIDVRIFCKDLSKARSILRTYLQHQGSGIPDHYTTVQLIQPNFTVHFELVDDLSNFQPIEPHFLLAIAENNEEDISFCTETLESLVKGMTKPSSLYTGLLILSNPPECVDPNLLSPDTNTYFMPADSTDNIISMFEHSLLLGLHLSRLNMRKRGPAAMKPILYLYNQDEDQLINVQVKKNTTTSSSTSGEQISFHYPASSHSQRLTWTVRADANSRLTDMKSQQNLSYLFWETAGDEPSEDMKTQTWQAPKGVFTVPRIDYIPFLEASLARLGLNEAEANDFIVFWLPLLNQNQVSNIKFEFDQSVCDSNSVVCSRFNCHINPVPDVHIKVMMLFQEVSCADTNTTWTMDRLLTELPNVAECRSGQNKHRLIAVEWGGRRLM